MLNVHRITCTMGECATGKNDVFGREVMSLEILSSDWTCIENSKECGNGVMHEWASLGRYDPAEAEMRRTALPWPPNEVVGRLSRDIH